MLRGHCTACASCLCATATSTARARVRHRPAAQEQAGSGKLIFTGDGEQTRDYAHVSDIIEGNLRAMHSTFTGVVNLISKTCQIFKLQDFTFCSFSNHCFSTTPFRSRTQISRKQYTPRASLAILSAPLLKGGKMLSGSNVFGSRSHA